MSEPCAFLPVSRADMDRRGWTQLDVLLVTGDGYFDHPSHGVAVIGRVLEAAGYRVGILSRPSWKDPADWMRMGRPALFVGIAAGAVDSTLNNYTADLARRRTDSFAPANDPHGRPDFATLVYAGAAKAAFPGVPVVLGGIEASTRRFAYYDYIKKDLRRSILVDSRADILVFGPGEAQTLDIAARLRNQEPLDDIPGTAVRRRTDPPANYTVLPSFADLRADRSQLLAQTALLEAGLGPFRESGFWQAYDEGNVICHPPAPADADAFDRTHELPFTRRSHPSAGPVPALETVRWSVIATRGCPGGCSFCAISCHQGRRVVSRSRASILREIATIAADPDFRGTITDVGGPTGNAWGLSIDNKNICRRCRRPSCLHPDICRNLDTDHGLLLQLLAEGVRIPGVRHLFIASGIRHDLALRSPEFIDRLAAGHTGGHLKVAPEHVDIKTLEIMRKPRIEVLEEFERKFQAASRKAKKEQYLLPYFIAGFPGCTKAAADKLGSWLQRRHQTVDQVQNFIPLPGTMAAALYACGKKSDGEKIFIPGTKERRRQKTLVTGTHRTGRPQKERRT